MDVKELRIGNLVYDENSQVHEITGHDLWSWEFADFKPIPINEEWLLKLGLAKDRNIYTKGWSYLYYFEDSYSFGINVECGIELRQIKHVHQLQNLYFALTGKELEVNQLTDV